MDLPAPDHLDHACAGLALGALASQAAAVAPAWLPGWARRGATIVAVAAAGGLKEAADRLAPSRHTAEVADALWTAAGAALPLAGTRVGSVEVAAAVAPREDGVAVLVALRW